jgi:hypothetical protein
MIFLTFTEYFHVQFLFLFSIAICFEVAGLGFIKQFLVLDLFAKTMYKLHMSEMVTLKI